MSEDPSNFASEAFAAACATLSQGRPSDDLAAGLADDFVYEDRRPGHLLGKLDAEQWREVTLATWDTASGIPQYRVHGVLAVRGDRFAVCRYDLDYGNGMMTENLTLFGLDATLTTVQAIIEFDADDVDGVIAELDRLAGPSSDRQAEEG